MLISACTSIGVHDSESFKNVDFGKQEEFRICIYTDEGITKEDASNLMKNVNQEFSQYGLEIKTPWIRDWKRTSFFGDGVIRELGQIPLEPPCDRQIALVGRNFGDFLFGLMGTEILGAVDLPTHTRGFIVARRASISQIFSSPSQVATHEFYHLFGCNHATVLTECYSRISKLKQLARANRESGNDFFPSVSWNESTITYRNEADILFKNAITSLELSSANKSTNIFGN